MPYLFGIHHSPLIKITNEYLYLFVLSVKGPSITSIAQCQGKPYIGCKCDVEHKTSGTGSSIHFSWMAKLQTPIVNIYSIGKLVCFPQNIWNEFSLKRSKIILQLNVCNRQWNIVYHWMRIKWWISGEMFPL